MWNVLFDPYHLDGDPLAPEEAVWHEGKSKTFNSHDQAAGSGKRTQARSHSTVAAFVW